MKHIEKIEIRDGIVIGTYKTNLSITLDDAREMVAERLAFQENRSFPVIVYISNVKASTKEARMYMGNEGLQGITMGAFIVSNTIEKIMLNFFLNIEKPAIPAKAFTREEDAIRWIKETEKKQG